MLTSEQKANRMNYIGGSDVPIIMNCSKFQTPLDLLKFKSGITTTEDFENIYTFIGNNLEGRIQTAINAINVDEITYQKTINGVNFECHIDGLNQERDQIQEIKVANQTIEQCMQSYEWQIRTYMLITQIDQARLVLLRRDHKFQTFIRDILNQYSLTFNHNFLNLDPTDAEQIRQDTKAYLDSLKLYKRDLSACILNKDDKKQQLLIDKVTLFWNYRNQLIENPALIDDQNFINQFLKEFND